MQVGYSLSEAGSCGVTIEGTELVLPISPLGNLAIEPLLEGATANESLLRIPLWERGSWIACCVFSDVSAKSPNCAAYSLYKQLFHAMKGRFLYRVWNYVPRINEGEGDDENYRQFCLGRSEAFHEEFGTDDATYMPAGTCVGCEGDSMIIVALGGEAEPSHYENPNQVPAYRYPREYGPRSPSFARASAVEADGLRYRYISGTAAVIGHESVGLENFDEQIRVTCDNIDCIARQANVGASSSMSYNFREAIGKVYLRHAEDFERAKAYLESRFPRWSDRLVYLRSDLCRRELLLEVELTIVDEAVDGSSAKFPV